MHHPQVGELELHYENLQIAGTDGQTLIVYHADPDSPTSRALALLATLAADRSPPRETVDADTGAEPQSESQHRPG
jgi:MmyB-like transcription regulator ligand binding domain